MTSRRLPVVGAFALLIILGIVLAGCTTQPPATPPATTPATTAPATTAPATTATPAATANTTAHKPGELLIATTTSLYDTGLLNKVQDLYQNETGIIVKITSQGTGQSIELAKRGDVDLLLVHSPSQEKTFMDDGYGLNQRCFAYNYFIIVGPQNDPAKIANMTPEAAFAKILALGKNNTAGVLFASRGDKSGTHTAEQGIWGKAGFNYTKDVTGPWYLSIGKGMGDTLVFASQKGAYTLSDEGTYLAYKGQQNLVPLVTEGGALLNRYSAIAVNPAKNPNVNIKEADRFINWLISKEGLGVVGDFGTEKYGKSLFTPLSPDVCVAAPFNCTCAGEVAPV
ncbi:MAG: substrate-binding domain-containing protein [Methanoregulaceae archaeon]|nr:substrate-binding domain-containing protein [Methanoregulaceae archaeon]